tara:strand:- start:29616 stop:35519 length:5904 start_codon:yes stop_codon:yes gene_type:complete
MFNPFQLFKNKTAGPGDPPKSHYKRLYGAAKDYGVGQEFHFEGGDRYIDKETGYAYFDPNNPKSQQEQQVPDNIWNTQRFLFNPMVGGYNQYVHNQIYDQQGNTLRTQELYDQTAKSEPQRMRRGLKLAKKDLKKYYIDDLGYTKKDARPLIKDKMQEVRSIKKIYDILSSNKSFEKRNETGELTYGIDYMAGAPQNYFDTSSKIDFYRPTYKHHLKKDFINDKQYIKRMPMAKAKKAYRKFLQTMRGLSKEEARNYTNYQHRLSDERVNETIKYGAKRFNVSEADFKKNPRKYIDTMKYGGIAGGPGKPPKKKYDIENKFTLDKDNILQGSLPTVEVTAPRIKNNNSWMENFIPGGIAQIQQDNTTVVKPFNPASITPQVPQITLESSLATQKALEGKPLAYQTQQKIKKVEEAEAEKREIGRRMMLSDEDRYREDKGQKRTAWDTAMAGLEAGPGSALALALNALKGGKKALGYGGEGWDSKGILPAYLHHKIFPNESDYEGQDWSVTQAINKDWADKNPGTAMAIDLGMGLFGGLGGDKALKMADKAMDATKVTRATNLADLNYAADWSKKYGYELPSDLKKISKSSKKTDQAIQKVIDEHNTFMRGVSTNWEKVDPRIIDMLKETGIDYINNPKAAAEYMATHIPGKTGGGRHGVDMDELYEKDLNVLYTTNADNSGEGYTYGQGYKVKVKRPTDFTSKNRIDWFEKNKVDYFQQQKLTEAEEKLFSNAWDDVLDSDAYKQKLNDLWVNKYKALEEQAEAAGDWGLKQQHQMARNKELSKWHNKTAQVKAGVYQKLTPPESFRGQILKSDHHPKSLENRMKSVKNSIKHRLNQEITNKYKEKRNILKAALKNNPKDKLTKDTYKSFVKMMDEEKASAWENFGKKELLEKRNEIAKNLDAKNKYAHYKFIGNPGEKVLDVVEATEIIPSTWHKRSRAHAGHHTKGFSAATGIGVASTAALLSQQNQTPKYRYGGITETDPPETKKKKKKTWRQRLNLISLPSFLGGTGFGGVKSIFDSARGGRDAREEAIEEGIKMGGNTPFDLDNFLNINNLAPLNTTPASESTRVESPQLTKEQQFALLTDQQRKQKVFQELADNTAKREAQEQIQQYKEPTLDEKAWSMAVNPMSAGMQLFGNEYGNTPFMPGNLNQGDHLFGYINPAYWADKIGKGTVDLTKGNYGDAAFNYMLGWPAMGMAGKGLAKGVSSAVKGGAEKILSSPKAMKFLDKKTGYNSSNYMYNRPKYAFHRPKVIQRDAVSKGNFTIMQDDLIPGMLEKLAGHQKRPFNIKIDGPQGGWLSSTWDPISQTYGLATVFNSPIQGGKAFKIMNDLTTVKNPIWREKTSLSFDSWPVMAGMGKRKDFTTKFHGHVPYNTMERHNTINSAVQKTLRDSNLSQIEREAFKRSQNLERQRAQFFGDQPGPLSKIDFNKKDQLEFAKNMVEKSGLKLLPEQMPFIDKYGTVMLPNIDVIRKYKEGGFVPQYRNGGIVETDPPKNKKPRPIVYTTDKNKWKANQDSIKQYNTSMDYAMSAFQDRRVIPGLREETDAAFCRAGECGTLPTFPGIKNTNIVPDYVYSALTEKHNQVKKFPVYPNPKVEMRLALGPNIEENIPEKKMLKTLTNISPKKNELNPEYSVVDYMNMNKMDSSKEARKKEALRLGIKGYDFSAAKNTELLNALKTPPVIEDYQGPIEEEPEDYGKTIGGKRVEHINVFSETEYKNWKKSGLTKEEYRKRKNRLNIGRTIDKDKWEKQQNWTSPIGTMKYGGIAGPGDPPKKKSKFNTFGFYDFGEKDILGNYKDFIAGGTLDYPIGDKQKIGVTGSLFQNLNFNRNPHEVGVTVPAAGLTYSPNQRSTYHGGIEVPIISNIPYVGTIAEPKGVARVNVRPWQNWEFGAEVKSDLNKSVDVAAEAKYFGENTDLFVRGMYNTMHGLSFMGSARHTFGGKKKGEPKDIMRYGGKVKKKDCNCKNK